MWIVVKVKNIAAIEETDDFPLAIRDEEIHDVWWRFVCDIQLKICLTVHIHIKLQISHASFFSEEKYMLRHINFLLFNCYVD